MTSKEKAEELVNRFKRWIDATDKYNYELESMRLYIAKQCAIICVDEIIKSIKQICVYTGFMYNDFETGKVTVKEPHLYWQQVKQEIEKL